MTLRKIKRVLLLATLGFATLQVLREPGFGWGFYAHKAIHREAVRALPEPLRRFFQAYRDQVAEHAVDADLRRRNQPEEAPRHYIDIDLYGSYPFSALPRDYRQAVRKYGLETVKKRGIAPWWVAHEFEHLVNVMRAGQTDSIVLVAADLGHYIADLHVPLHTVENYDGQLSGNDGIHRRFESEMIERFAPRLRWRAEPARLVNDPLKAIFDVVLHSYRLHQAILRADTQARNPGRSYRNPDDYDDSYYAALFERVGGLAERQLSAAATTVASYWYAAWVRAGRPKLHVRNGR